jgi:hypothetical protein
LRRLHARLHQYEALRLTAVSVAADHLVYVFLTDAKLEYEGGRSRIAYIGTTKNGAHRLASSAASRATKILNARGVWSFDARIITCRPRQRVKTWRILERALLLRFKDRFLEPPLCNVHGKSMREGDEFEYFSPRRIDRLIDELS